jgi:hypothetical protein
MGDFLSKLCHGGEETILCFRCLGVWAGMALALPLAPFTRRKIPLLLWMILGLLFIQMPILGFGKVPLPEAVKTLSGHGFALSVTFGMARGPARRWLKPDPARTAWIPFLVIGLSGAAVLQALIHWRTAFAHAALDALSCIGFLAAAVLAIIGLASILLEGA